MEHGKSHNTLRNLTTKALAVGALIFSTGGESRADSVVPTPVPAEAAAPADMAQSVEVGSRIEFNAPAANHDSHHEQSASPDAEDEAAVDTVIPSTVIVDTKVDIPAVEVPSEPVVDAEVPEPVEEPVLVDVGTPPVAPDPPAETIEGAEPPSQEPQPPAPVFPEDPYGEVPIENQPSGPTKPELDPENIETITAAIQAEVRAELLDESIPKMYLDGWLKQDASRGNGSVNTDIYRPMIHMDAGGNAIAYWLEGVPTEANPLPFKYMYVPADEVGEALKAYMSPDTPEAERFKFTSGKVSVNPEDNKLYSFVDASGTLIGGGTNMPPNPADLQLYILSFDGTPTITQPVAA